MESHRNILIELFGKYNKKYKSLTSFNKKATIFGLYRVALADMGLHKDEIRSFDYRCVIDDMKCLGFHGHNTELYFRNPNQDYEIMRLTIKPKKGIFVVK